MSKFSFIINGKREVICNRGPSTFKIFSNWSVPWNVLESQGHTLPSVIYEPGGKWSEIIEKKKCIKLCLGKRKNSKSSEVIVNVLCYGPRFVFVHESEQSRIRSSALRVSAFVHLLSYRTPVSRKFWSYKWNFLPTISINFFFRFIWERKKTNIEIDLMWSLFSRRKIFPGRNVYRYIRRTYQWKNSSGLLIKRENDYNAFSPVL
jgi:hypothetical protein